MKKLMLVLACVLMFAMPAMAAEKSFSKMTLDIPKGWTAAELEGGVVSVTAPNKEAALSIVYDKTQGLSLAEIAKGMSKQLGGTAPKHEDGLYIFTFKRKGVESTSLVGGDKDDFVMFTLTDPKGKHSDAMAKIIETMEPK